MHDHLLKALERYSPQELERIVESGIRQIESQEAARKEWQQAADDRYKFVVERGSMLKATRPDASEYEIVVEVRKLMVAQGSRFKFGKNKYLSEDTIKQYLRKAGVFPL